MKTAICCIAKCENNYIKEWVDYHLALGFSHIFIYDNNDLIGERIEPLFNNYNNVTIINCYGEISYQNKAYISFYNSYGKRFDWIAFIDIDEFITFSDHSNIGDINVYLEKISSKYGVIHLNWMTYGDNDIVEYDSNDVLARFKVPLKYDKRIQYDFPENNHVKSIVRGNLRIESFGPHTPIGSFLICDELGNSLSENLCFKPYSFNVIYVRHFCTKTIYEWLIKISKGIATPHSFSELYSIDRFFLYNEKTKEKEDVIRYFNIYRTSLDHLYSTNLSIYKDELLNERENSFRLQRDLNVIRNSKAYKLGRILLYPFKFFIHRK